MLGAVAGAAMPSRRLGEMAETWEALKEGSLFRKCMCVTPRTFRNTGRTDLQRKAEGHISMWDRTSGTRFIIVRVTPLRGSVL